MRDCHIVREQARQRFEEESSSEEEESEEEEQQVSNKPEELVQRPGSSGKPQGPAPVFQGLAPEDRQTVASTGFSPWAMPAEPQRQQQLKKKVRRIHSGDPDEDAIYEEYDDSVQRYVPLGTARQPRFIPADAESVDDDEEMLDDAAPGVGDEDVLDPGPDAMVQDNSGGDEDEMLDI